MPTELCHFIGKLVMRLTVEREGRLGRLDAWHKGDESPIITEGIFVWDKEGLGGFRP
jgi:hypothetical protein